MSLDVYLTMEVDTGGDEPYSITLYDGNYTHNVTPMWSKAGVYKALYKRDEWDREITAAELIPVLQRGYTNMERDSEGYKELNPSNGWGSYGTAIEWLGKLLSACREHPKATYGCWR